MFFLLAAILTPIIGGAALLIVRKINNRNTLLGIVGILLVLTAALTFAAIGFSGDMPVSLFALTANLNIFLCLDGIGKLFAALATIVFVCAGFFSFTYMKHEENEKRYFGYYLMVYGVLNGLCFAGNLITFYLCFEMLTLSSMALVLHNESREAIMAGLKYLFFSLCGAYMALFGVYFVAFYNKDITFVPGGFIKPEVFEAHSGLFLTVAFLMIIGFSVKAGMLPFHAWLPTAHPVAPAPASAVLSAMIVKAGVLALIRVVYFVYGPGLLQGSLVQKVWLILTLLTVFMGSMLAYREPVLKKRLAYSTVSQLSYILFGLAVMNAEAVTGSLLHVLAHGFIKAVLFLCAGAIIFMTGKTRADELCGIGKQMPITILSYTMVSLGLIGIPPTGGFISKWWLAVGALFSDIPVFSVLGPVILLVSALLTAGYLLPITIQGFFPGAEHADTVWEKKEPPMWMLIPILIMTVLSILLGLFPNACINWMQTFVTAML